MSSQAASRSPARARSHNLDAGSLIVLTIRVSRLVVESRRSGQIFFTLEPERRAPARLVEAQLARAELELGAPIAFTGAAPPNFLGELTDCAGTTPRPAHRGARRRNRWQ